MKKGEIKKGEKSNKQKKNQKKREENKTVLKAFIFIYVPIIYIELNR